MLSRTYEFDDCLLAAASEVASEPSGKQVLEEVVSGLSFVDSAVAADDVFLKLFLLSFTLDDSCLDEDFVDSRCSIELCFLLHFVHDLDVQIFVEWPDFKQLTHNLCFCAKFSRSGGVSC